MIEAQALDHVDGMQKIFELYFNRIQHHPQTLELNAIKEEAADLAKTIGLAGVHDFKGISEPWYGHFVDLGLLFFYAGNENPILAASTIVRNLKSKTIGIAGVKVVNNQGRIICAEYDIKGDSPILVGLQISVSDAETPNGDEQTRNKELIYHQGDIRLLAGITTPAMDQLAQPKKDYLSSGLPHLINVLMDGEVRQTAFASQNGFTFLINAGNLDISYKPQQGNRQLRSWAMKMPLST